MTFELESLYNYIQMATLTKQACPTCGQSANEREISLFSGMVDALFRVWQWCQQKNVHEFSRQEIKHLFLNENEMARFGDWILFGGLVYRPDKRKGHYGINGERVSAFFAGKLPIPRVIIKNPLMPIGEQLKMGTAIFISEVPNINTFLDENKEFIANYVGKVDFAPRPQYTPRAPRKKLKRGQIACKLCGEALIRRMDTSPTSDSNTLAVKEYFVCSSCTYDTRNT